VGTLQASVPLNMVQKWMGHARISTTLIYTNVSGPEERFFAEKFWQADGQDEHPPEAHPASGRKRLSRRQRKQKVSAHIVAANAVGTALVLLAGAAATVLGIVQMAAHL
jgi:hypothetical protein